jgi:COMPASS component SWD2
MAQVLLKSMGIAKVFKDNEASVTSMDFSADGELLVTSSADETLHVYAAAGQATMRRAIFSKKYGIDLVRFTHHREAVVFASANGWDETLRYLSLHDNCFLRYFRGHRDRVVSLCVSPVADTLVSASLDATVRMWDLRVAPCQGVLRVAGGRAVAAYDPSGMVLAVAAGGGDVRLFDVRGYDRGPFASARVDVASSSSAAEWSSAQFSDDGRFLLLSTGDNTLLLVDAFLPAGC